jgi:hypothetical protein
MTSIYPRDVSGRLHDRLTQQRDAIFASISGTEAEIETYRSHLARVEPIPKVGVLADLLDVAFFASITQEEGHGVVFSLLYCNPDVAIESKWPCIRFEADLPFTVEQIRKLSPATDPSSVDIAVFEANNTLWIWGLVYVRSAQPGVRSYPLGLTILTRQPGVLLVRQGLDDILTFSPGQVAFFNKDAHFDSTTLRLLIAKAFHEGRAFPDRYQSAAKIIDMAWQKKMGTLVQIQLCITR